MQAKIDYLAFTVPTPYPICGGSVDLEQMVHDMTDEYLDYAWRLVAAPLKWTLRPARGFYQYTSTDVTNSLSLSWGDVNNHIYVQISGKGCDILRDAGIMDKVIRICHQRVSRIDVCADIETDIDPRAFIAEQGKTRIKGSGEARSVGGRTRYVGSRKSERFARVYRYDEPHPRSHLLRVEHECKGQWAKTIALELHANGLQAALAAAAFPFRWEHPLWRLDALEAPKLKAREYDKVGNGTIRWLLTQVQPALLRLHRQGELDLNAWCKDLLNMVD